MPTSQDAVHDLAIKPIRQALLSRLEREVSPHNRPRWQQSPKEDVRAQMHVVVTVDSRWREPVKTVELVELGRHEVLKGADEPGVKHCAGNAAGRQTSSNFPLTIHEA